MKRVRPVISIEGGDGSGKTTNLELLKEHLETIDVPYMISREPGGVRIAEAIRAIVLGTEYTEMDPKTEALLFCAARRQHLVEKVMPAVEEGKLVILDRFVDSSLVYQGYLRGIGVEEVYRLNMFAIEDFLPDMTLVFDLDPEIGLERINANPDREVNRLDLEGLEFQKKVREGYKQLAKAYPDRVVLIDGSQTIDAVFVDVRDKIDELLRKF